MPQLRRVRATTLRQSRERVLPDGFQHVETHLPVPAVPAEEEAVIDQRGYAAQDIDVLVPVNDRLRLLHGAPTREHGELREQLLLVGLQQLVAPIQRGAERLLPRWDILRSAG